MSKIGSLLIFASGAAVGAVVTWRVLETKYEQLVQEEIESVKEAFANRPCKCESEDTESEDRQAAEEAKDKPSIVEYASMVQKNGYIDYSDMSRKEEPTETKVEDAKVDRPYVITPEEFGEFDDYRQIGLSYYSDGILVDDDDDIIENVEEVVGLESLKHFGEYEDDAVHVRNDKFKCDYEILQIPERYSAD
jgi:hypothetical protein